MKKDAQIWPEDCHGGIEKIIEKFKAELPGWWYSLGECQVSCDASCAPTSLSPDINLIPLDERFNSGFHADIPQPSKLSYALLVVMHEALAAKVRCAGNEAEAESYEEVSRLICNATGCGEDLMEDPKNPFDALPKDVGVLKEKDGPS